MIADEMDAARENLIQEFAELLTGQPKATLTAIQIFAASEEHELSYELAQLLVRVLARVDDSGLSLQRLAEQGDATGRFHWYLRRSALQELGNRDRPDLVPLFRRVLLDAGSEGEVRQAALAALVRVDDTSSLPLIRTIDPASWYGSEETLLEARGLLGDVTASPELIEVSYDPWRHRSSAAVNGLDALQRRHGSVDPLLDEVDPGGGGRQEARLERLAVTALTPAVRRWALDHLRRQESPVLPGILLRSLGDTDWLVQQGSSGFLTGLAHPPFAALQNMVTDPSAQVTARLWAAYTLLKLGEQPFLSAIPDLKVELPGVPQDVREAIVRYWSESAEMGTDVRWLIEGLTLPAWSEADTDAIQADFPTVRGAFERAGLPLDELVEAGEFHQQGGGTYVVGQAGEVQVALSTLGRFAALHAWGGDNILPVETLASIRQALAEVGWTWVDPAVLSVTVVGLNVYFFGRRESLSVQDLLFYWQD